MPILNADWHQQYSLLVMCEGAFIPGIELSSLSPYLDK